MTTTIGEINRRCLWVPAYAGTTSAEPVDRTHEAAL